jgi:VanZ family protein
VVHRLFSHWVLPLAWTAAIQVLLCLPGKDLPDTSDLGIPNFDKYVHIILFGGMVLLWSYFFYSRKKSPQKLKTIFFGIFLFALFNGILMEYIQLYFIPGRSFDVGDMFADLLGASLAYGISNVKLLNVS